MTPPDVTKYTDRDLLVMTVQKVSGMENEFREFRVETREELQRHAKDIQDLRENQAKTQGGLGFGRWILTALGPLSALAGWLAGRAA